MRRAFAIIFSLLLVLGQWAGATPSASQRLADACETACDCQMVSCCVAPAPAPTSGNPAAPVPAPRVTEQQLVAALDAAVEMLADQPVIKTSLPPATVQFSPSSVPLYRWNCTLLI